MFHNSRFLQKTIHGSPKYQSRFPEVINLRIRIFQNCQIISAVSLEIRDVESVLLASTFPLSRLLGLFVPKRIERISHLITILIHNRKEKLNVLDRYYIIHYNYNCDQHKVRSRLTSLTVRVSVKQWVPIHSRDFYLRNVCKVWNLPGTACAPSAHMPTQFFRS